MHSGTHSDAREFDYIVVGAGTAGCVLAARLAEDGDYSVALIEAGGSERHPYVRIPAAVGAAIMNPRFGWGLTTVPQPALKGRKLPLPRGKLIGGSGSINGMAYYRGPARDFDDWAAAGNPGWSYADLLPYFLRSEHNPEFAGSPYHATGGPMGVSFPKSRNRLCDAFNESMRTLGYTELDDFNIPDPNGYGYRQGTIWNGRRVSTASAYLRPAMKQSNIDVLTHTQARRILFKGRRAAGVEIQTGTGIAELRARREIVLAAGSYHSPHILLNSGVGDTENLQTWGVKAPSPRRRPPCQGPSVGADCDGYGRCDVLRALPQGDAAGYRPDLPVFPARIGPACEQPVRDERLHPHPSGRGPAGHADRVPAGPAQHRALPHPARARFRDRRRLPVSRERGCREPGGPGPARGTADRSQYRCRRGGSALPRRRPEARPEDPLARGLRAVSRP